MVKRKSEIIINRKNVDHSTFTFKDWNGHTYLELDTTGKFRVADEKDLRDGIDLEQKDKIEEKEIRWRKRK